MMRVPIVSSDLPLATVAAFSSYDKLDYRVGGSMSGSGVPVAYATDTRDAQLVKSPRLLNSVANRDHYLHCILITNTTLTQLSYILIQTIKVTFYNYDG